MHNYDIPNALPDVRPEDLAKKVLMGMGNMSQPTGLEVQRPEDRVEQGLIGSMAQPTGLAVMQLSDEEEELLKEIGSMADQAGAVGTSQIAQSPGCLPELSGVMPTISQVRPLNNMPRKKPKDKVQEETETKMSDACDAGDDLTYVTAEADDDVQQLQEIKAKTMFNMVQEIDGFNGKRQKVLFLTNSQADVLSGSPDGISKMLAAFEVPSPKLLINLLVSPGGIDTFFLRMTTPGGENGRLPWTSLQDAEVAESRLDRFMKDVLLPLAIETNAVVLLTPLVHKCMLSASFARVLCLEQARFGDKPPFTVIGVCAEMVGLYGNEDMNATWRDMRRQVKNWRGRRDKEILDLFHGKAWPGAQDSTVDLEASMANVLLVDSVDAKKQILNVKGPCNKLITELTRYFSSHIPSICIKTGSCTMCDSIHSTSSDGSLGVAIDAMNGGSPLVFLDLRPRPMLTQDIREERIVAAKNAYAEMAASLRKCDTADYLFVSTLAHAHDVLFGLKEGQTSRQGNQEPVALHIAIDMASSQEAVRSDGVPATQSPDFFSLVVNMQEQARRANSNEIYDMQEQAQYARRASSNEIYDFIDFLVEQFFKNAWNLLPEDSREACFQEHYHGLVATFKMQAQTLLTAPEQRKNRLYSVNVNSGDCGAGVFESIVMLDRLPKSNPLEGLKLLCMAWEEFDIVTHIATFYKRLSKVMYMLLLVVGLGAVGVATLMDKDVKSSSNDVSGKPRATVLLVLSVCSSALLAILSYVNPVQRWRSLRSSASALESLIWKYRTRVEPFASDALGCQRPENTLMSALNDWRDECMSGTDLSTTGLEQTYKPKVFKHYQRQEAGPLPRCADDDYHSPLKPDLYITVRLKPVMAFYQRRVPSYAYQKNCMQIASIALASSGALLVFCQLDQYVAIVSALAGAILSWSEFTDIGRKLERYTKTIRSMKKLLAWWDSLDKVDKNSTARITQLVSRSEDIINAEIVSWHSTSSSGNDAMNADNAGGPNQGLITGAAEQSTAVRQDLKRE